MTIFQLVVDNDYTLGWAGFPDTNNEFEDYKSFKTHKLEVLLHLSGLESKVRDENDVEWSAVVAWDPSIRYKPVGSAKEAEVKEMISAAEKLLHALEVL